MSKTTAAPTEIEYTKEFSAGQLVTLKSGGPSMTVVGELMFSPGRFKCLWADSDCRIHTEIFSGILLKPADDKPDLTNEINAYRHRIAELEKANASHLELVKTTTEDNRKIGTLNAILEEKNTNQAKVLGPLLDLLNERENGITALPARVQKLLDELEQSRKEKVALSSVEEKNTNQEKVLTRLLEMLHESSNDITMIPVRVQGLLGTLDRLRKQEANLNVARNGCDPVPSEECGTQSASKPLHGRVFCITMPEQELQETSAQWKQRCDQFEKETGATMIVVSDTKKVFEVGPSATTEPATISDSYGFDKPSFEKFRDIVAFGNANRSGLSVAIAAIWNCRHLGAGVKNTIMDLAHQVATAKPTCGDSSKDERIKELEQMLAGIPSNQCSGCMIPDGAAIIKLLKRRTAISCHNLYPDGPNLSIGFPDWDSAYAAYCEISKHLRS